MYPTDPYSNVSYWPVGPGQLTNIGKIQQFRFGQWLRQRYGDVLLPNEYSENDIYVRSTDSDRTLTSASVNLAGLYPPMGDQLWNKFLLWQPIPVHTVTDTDDFLLGGTLPSCPLYEMEYAKVLASPEVQDDLERLESKAYVDYILQSAGINTNGTAADKFLQIILIRDTLFVERLHGKVYVFYISPHMHISLPSYLIRLPQWTNYIFPSKWLDRLALLFYVLPAYNPLLAKFRAGFILKDILDRSRLKANCELVPDRSVWMYSVHDINISTLLKALGLFDVSYRMH